MVKRLIDWHLLHWKKSSYRKPLLLRGARQVGKTHAVRKLGQTFDSFVEINFELAENARSIFEGDLEPERILRDLSFYADKAIVPGQTPAQKNCTRKAERSNRKSKKNVTPQERSITFSRATKGGSTPHFTN